MKNSHSPYRVGVFFRIVFCYANCVFGCILGKKKGLCMNIHVEKHSIAGSLWFMGWLFSIGFLNLGFWQGVLGIVVWPYFLGGQLQFLLP